MAGKGLTAVVVTKRNHLRDVIRGSLKKNGINEESITYSEKKIECIDALVNIESCVLILDWEIGSGIILEVLQSIQERHQADSLISFLFAAQLDEKIIAVGAEFGVYQVHTGDVTSEKIKTIVKNLVHEAKTQTPIKKLMRSVSDCRSLDQWENAAKILLQLIKKEPKNYRVLCELAENYLHEGKLDEAHKLLSKLARLDPSDPKCMYLLGKCLLKQKKPDKAIEAMKKAKLLNPYNIDRLIQLGNTLLSVGKNSEAAKNFDDVIKIAPASKAAKKGKSTCLLMDGEVNEALKLLQGSVKGYELASVFNTAAVMSMKNGKIPEGMNLYNSAAQAIGADKKILASIFFNKGIGFFKWGKKNDAKLSFEEAVRLDPGHKDASHNVAALSGKLGKGKSVKYDDKTATAAISKLDFDDSIEVGGGGLMDDEDDFY